MVRDGGHFGAKYTEIGVELTQQILEHRQAGMWDIRGWKRLTAHDEPPLVAVREEFLAWLAEVPEPSRLDLDARLRSERDDAHLSARLELFVHHYFLSTGWRTQIHPVVPNATNHPDFLVEKDSNSLFIECRIVQDDMIVTQQDERLRKLADDISSGLGRAVILHPLSDLPPSIPTNRIARWIDQQSIPGDGPDRFELDYWHDHQGFHYGIRVIIAKQKNNEEMLTGVHGVVFPAHTISNGRRLRMALEEKAIKYGRLDVPFVIVISGETKSPLTTAHEQEALYGHRVWQIPLRGPAVITETRTDDGFFGNSAIKYRGVSAVLVYRFEWRNEGHEHQLHMYHNPLALKPVDPGLLPEIPRMLLGGSGTLQWTNSQPDETDAGS